MTVGKQPYAECTSDNAVMDFVVTKQKVITYTATEYVLAPQPEEQKQQKHFFNLILSPCWRQEYRLRTSFFELRDKLISNFSANEFFQTSEIVEVKVAVGEETWKENPNAEFGEVFNRTATHRRAFHGRTSPPLRLPSSSESPSSLSSSTRKSEVSGRPTIAPTTLLTSIARALRLVPRGEAALPPYDPTLKAPSVFFLNNTFRDELRQHFEDVQEKSLMCECADASDCTCDSYCRKCNCTVLSEIKRITFDELTISHMVRIDMCHTNALLCR